MVGQRDRRGKESFERRLFDVLRGRALVARVQIIVEEGAEIDFVEGVGGVSASSNSGAVGDGGEFRRQAPDCSGGGFDIRAVGFRRSSAI